MTESQKQEAYMDRLFKVREMGLRLNQCPNFTGATLTLRPPRRTETRKKW
jgi:hypothetical protein